MVTAKMLPDAMTKHMAADAPIRYADTGRLELKAVKKVACSLAQRHPTTQTLRDDDADEQANWIRKTPTTGRFPEFYENPTGPRSPFAGAIRVASQFHGAIAHPAPHVPQIPRRIARSSASPRWRRRSGSSR